MTKFDEALDSLRTAGLMFGADADAYSRGHITRPIFDAAESRYKAAESALRAIYEADRALVQQLATALKHLDGCREWNDDAAALLAAKAARVEVP